MLRKKFAGKPEHVVNYLFLLAEEVGHVTFLRAILNMFIEYDFLKNNITAAYICIRR